MDRTKTTDNSTSGSGDQSYVTCDKWIDSQDVIYQISSLLFAVAFLIPDDFRCHVTLMRATLCLGCACAVGWGTTVLCHVDVIAWYSVFLSINVFHLTYAVCIAWPTPVRPELRDLHTKLFRPLKITRRQFRELCGCGQIIDLPRGTDYAVEGSTGAGERLSILLIGRCVGSDTKGYIHG